MRDGRRGGWTGSIDLSLLVLNLKGKIPLLHALDLRLGATEVEVSYLDRRRVRVTICHNFRVCEDNRRRHTVAAASQPYIGD